MATNRQPLLQGKTRSRGKWKTGCYTVGQIHNGSPRISPCGIHDHMAVRVNSGYVDTVYIGYINERGSLSKGVSVVISFFTILMPVLHELAIQWLNQSIFPSFSNKIIYLTCLLNMSSKHLVNVPLQVYRYSSYCVAADGNYWTVSWWCHIHYITQWLAKYTQQRHVNLYDITYHA